MERKQSTIQYIVKCAMYEVYPKAASENVKNLLNWWKKNLNPPTALTRNAFIV